MKPHGTQRNCEGFDALAAFKTRDCFRAFPGELPRFVFNPALAATDKEKDVKFSKSRPEDK